MNTILTPEQLEALRRLDACTLANAIETFHERLRNEGFADRTHPLSVPAACRRCSATPPRSRFADRRRRRLAALTPTGPTGGTTSCLVPAPRVVVVQDVATRPGLGLTARRSAYEHPAALGCVGAVTNGSVRDIPAAESLGFHLFAGSVSVSHAYVHIVEIGTPVEIGGLKIQSGDLLHGDLHGVQSIPLDIAAADSAGRRRKSPPRSRTLIALCQSPEFSIEKLRAAVDQERF